MFWHAFSRCGELHWRVNVVAGPPSEMATTRSVTGNKPTRGRLLE